jgi:hypothetical protein
MDSTFDELDWKTVGRALDMSVDTDSGRGTVSLRTEDNARRIVIDDNGGEFNTTVIESDAARGQPEFSVAYTAHGRPIGPITLAYRVACHAQDRQIDYRIDLDRWPVDLARDALLRALADQIGKNAERPASSRRVHEVADTSELLDAHASRLTFERALRRGLGLDAGEYASIVAEVWELARPGQFSALGHAIAEAPILGSRNIVGTRE